MYAKILNGAIVIYPYTWDQFTRDNNNTVYSLPLPDLATVFPNSIAAVGGYQLVSVQTVVTPTYDTITQYLQEGTPVLTNGVWTQVWNVVDMPLATAQANKQASLLASYQAAVNGPVSFTNAAGVASKYSAGSVMAINGRTANENLTDALTAGSAAWTLGKWLDINNVAQTFTYADLQGLAAAMEAATSLDWQDLVAKVADVQAATTTADLRTITF